MSETPIAEMSRDELSVELTELMLRYAELTERLSGITERINEIHAAFMAIWDGEENE